MRTKIVLGLMALLVGCTSFHTRETQDTEVTTVKKDHWRVSTPVKASETPGNGSSPKALWHLLSSGEIELEILQRESGRREWVLIQSSLSTSDLPVGHYSITALKSGGVVYDAFEYEEAFQFEIFKNAETYVGSYIVNCPKVGQEFHAELRKLKYFNRVSFSSNNGTCELVVGNDRFNVARAWSKLRKKNEKLLKLGF